MTRVRFPSPAPMFSITCGMGVPSFRQTGAHSDKCPSFVRPTLFRAANDLPHRPLYVLGQDLRWAVTGAGPMQPMIAYLRVSTQKCRERMASDQRAHQGQSCSREGARRETWWRQHAVRTCSERSFKRVPKTCDQCLPSLVTRCSPRLVLCRRERRPRN